jgi:CheY-like chemotaxis protein/predicted regulator of Ras-like GTPase activity (Roadblock/LC7/MglB family)
MSMPKVLVIDDSVSVRKVVERALAGRQIDVVCAASGSEALEQIERDAPDVIVCDVVMPDRDGYEICEFVKNHPRLGATPVLLMSGIVNDEVRQRAARARSEGVLSKPFAAEDLLKRLDGFLGPLPPKLPDAASVLPPVPASTPTLMPVSELTVEPLVATAPESGITAKPEPGIKPDPGILPKPEPLARPEPLIASKPEPALRPEPLVTAKPEPVVELEPAIPPMLEPVLKPEPAVMPKADPVITLEREGTPPSSGRVPAERVVPPAAVTAPTPTDGSAAILAQFTAMDGVHWAVLADREGFVVEATANAGVDADVAAALSACLAESSDGLGRELGRGTLHGIILEYEKGMVVIYGAGATGLLAVGLTESSVLGKVRYFAKKVLPELTRVL